MTSYETGTAGMGTTGTGAGMGTTGMGTGAGMGATTGMGAGQYGKVVVTIKSAHNMNDKAWIGKSDPYCVVKVSDAEIQTQHVKNAGEHCVWDESFAFNNVAPSDVIEFNVYDHNRLMKDAHMGQGSLSMRQVFEEGRMETRVPLASRSGMKDAGEIWVSIRTEGAGMETGGMGTTGMGTTAGMGATTGMGTEGGYREESETRERRESEYATTGTAGMGTTTGAGYGTTGTEGVRTGEFTETGRTGVCGQEYFTKTEDRPVIKERVEYVKEHRPVEKEFVVETRATGVEREAMEGRVAEHMGTKERVVSEAQPRTPCE